MRNNNYIACENCGKSVPKIVKICPYCGKYRFNFKDTRRYKMLKKFLFKDKKKREKIVKYLKRYHPTLETAGKRYGISRERIRQIYKRETGKPYRIRLDTNRKNKEEETRKRLKSVRYHCKACGKAVTYKEGYHKHFYCNGCHYIRTVLRRDPQKTFICDECGIKYHPLHNWKFLGYENQLRFHNHRCYEEYMRKYGRPSYTIRKKLRENI